MKPSVRKHFTTFGLFLLIVALYGALVALINQLLRKNSIDPTYTQPMLIASTVYVYYKAWKWLCRKLDRHN